MASLPPPTHLQRVLLENTADIRLRGSSRQKEGEMSSVHEADKEREEGVLLNSPSSPTPEMDPVQVRHSFAERRRIFHSQEMANNFFQLCKTTAMLVIIAYIVALLITKLLEGEGISSVRNETHALLQILRMFNGATALSLQGNTSIVNRTI